MEFSPEKRAGDDDEEGQIEQFFAIVQRYRDACAKLRRREEIGVADGGGEEAGVGGCVKKMKAVAAAGRSSVPKFQREDFKTAAELPAAVTGSGEVWSSGKRGEVMKMDEEDGDDGKLDLKLSL